MRPLRVLMFGWEFPPYSSGGLGTACYGLTKGLSNKGVHVTFVVPRMPEASKHKFVKVISADVDKVKIKFVEVDTLLQPYMTTKTYKARYEEHLVHQKRSVGKLYGKDLYAEVRRYALQAAKIARKEKFDIIHCHDWMTYGAGIKAKEVSGKPLVIHVHATEFDRTGGTGVNSYVYGLEMEGMQKCDRIITVSNYTKKMVATYYAIDPNKIQPVHNAVELTNKKHADARIDDKKTVLFLGRITIQKGPDYFLQAAKKVLEHNPNVRFVIAGSGDMEPYMIEQSANLGISDKVLFAGFLRGEDIHKAYQMADLYVMPSVSEPFGITPLEAMSNGTPVIISKQSGVSEVISHCLKVDFWDINQMANQMLAVLAYPNLSNSLKENAYSEIQTFTWDTPAEKCISVYNTVLGGAS